jgi:hypothetical protein
MVFSVIIRGQHKQPEYGLSKYTVRLDGLPKFKDEMFASKKRMINQIFIESHIKNLSDKIEVMDINFGPNSTFILDTVQQMHLSQ